MIAAVTLDKDSSKTTSSRVFIIVFNIRLEYKLRKMIVLVNNDSEKKNYFTTIRKEERSDRRFSKTYHLANFREVLYYFAVKYK
jgi:hypothetical protein